jgi:hypothetical protein
VLGMRASARRAAGALIALAWLCAGPLASPGAQAAAEEPSLEYPVKAAYLLNFAKLTEWPRDAFAAPTTPFTIGIVGADPFGETIDLTVAGRKIDNRPIVVRRLQWGDDPRLCHILFISAADGARIGELTSRIERRPVLIVGESPDLARRGAIINFKIEDGRVRFEVNVDAARRARLTISSQVLTYATVVR